MPPFQTTYFLTRDRIVFTWAEVARLLEKSDKEDWEHGVLHRDVWVDVCDVGHEVGQGPVVTAHVGAAGERENGVLMEYSWIRFY